MTASPTGAARSTRVENGSGAPTEFDGAYATRVMLLFASLVAIVLYVEGMLTPSLPEIASEFGVSISSASLILSVYLVTGVALSPVVGKLGDIYGKKRVLTIVLLFYVAAVSVTGFSPNFTFMVASRAAQGAGITIMPLAMSLVREEFPRDQIPRAQGILSGMFGAGFAVSLPLGSWVASTYGWRTTYHTAVPFVFLLAILAFVWVRESSYSRPSTRIDYVGAALLAGSLASLVLALSEGPTWGWTSDATLGLAAVSVALVIPLAFQERRFRASGGEPVLDGRLLTIRNVLVTNLVIAIAGLGMFLAFQALTYRFELPAPVGFGQSIFQTGVNLVPLAVAMLIFAPLASVITKRVGVKPLAVLGAAVASTGFFVLTLTTTLTQMLEVEFVIGAGLAVINASIINLLVLTVDPREMGLATAMNGVVRSLGSSIGAPVAASLLTTFSALAVVGYVPNTSPAVPILRDLPTATAFHDAYLIASALFLLSGVVVLFAREVLGPRALETWAPAPAGANAPTSIAAAPASGSE